MKSLELIFKLNNHIVGSSYNIRKLSMTIKLNKSNSKKNKHTCQSSACILQSQS